jgi:hypothetical protein
VAARSSFFEKKEPKKLLSVWLRFAARLGSLRPDVVFGARKAGVAVTGGRALPRLEQSFFGSFFSKKEPLPSCRLPSR